MKKIGYIMLCIFLCFISLITGMILMSVVYNDVDYMCESNGYLSKELTNELIELTNECIDYANLCTNDLEYYRNITGEPQYNYTIIPNI